MNQKFTGTNFSLQDLMGFGVLDHAELVGEVSAAASGEAQLEQGLGMVETGCEIVEQVPCCLVHFS